MLDDAIFQKIADMDLTELKKKRPEVLLQNLLASVEEYDACLIKLQKVVPAYENIKEFGVTSSICETYKDILWDEVQYDITPFENAPYAQLSYCIEGLGAVIRKIYTVLRNIIWKIKDFFLVDGFPAEWFDACERKRKSVDKFCRLIDQHHSSFDHREFMGRLVRNYPFGTWDTRKRAVQILIASLKQVTANADQKAAWNGFFTNCRTQFADLKITVNNYKVTILPEETKRVDSVYNLGWDGMKMPATGSGIANILKSGTEVKSKMYMFERMIVKSERNISDVLTGKKEPEVIRDEETIKCIRAYAQTADIIYKVILDLSSGWETLARIFMSCCSSYKPGVFD